MPDIIQCKICSKPFQSMGGKICHSCLNEIDDAFIKIRDFLYDNPEKSSIDDISEGTETPKKIVLHLIDENRLSVTGADYEGPTCRYCNRPISRGVICDKCRNDLSQTLLKSITKQNKTDTGKDTEKSKMHFDFRKRKF